MKTALLFLILLFSLQATPQKKMVEIKEFEQEQLNTNDEFITLITTEFFAEAKNRRLEYQDKKDKLQGIFFVERGLEFIGEITEDETAIYINSELRKYPNLARVILFRQLGKLYGLKDNKTHGHSIMGTHWEIDFQHEYYATGLRERLSQKDQFFKLLEEKIETKSKL